MSDNRKYYYLKLKENYFDEDAIVLLESMQDGILYSNILLKLYLKSLKNGGKLQLDENIPLTAQSSGPLGQGDCRRRGRDGTGHYRRYPPGLGEHEKIFEKCSVSLLFLIFQLTRLMRGRSFPPTTE